MSFTFLGVALALVNADLCFLLAQRYVHIYQLESYKPKFYLKWVREHMTETVLIPAVIGVVLFMLQFLLRGLSEKGAALGCCFIYFALIGFQLWRTTRQPQKKPLVYTQRIKRYLVYLGVVLVLLGVLLSGIGLPFILAALTPFVVWLCAYIVLPVEKAINLSYFNDAKQRLAAKENLIRVGITGSFGKTSTKFFAKTILDEKYNTLATPSSFNTPMGLTRVIREQLSDENEVFLAEMGAKHRGDIAELCGLVHPTIGIISSVGKQHLDTFGDLDTIIETKYELIDALPEDGFAIFPDDEGICRLLYNRTKVDKAIVGLTGQDDLFMGAENIEVGSFGSRFDLVCAGEKIACETRLLGLHNIENVLLGAALAKKLGLSLEQIRSGIAKIEPVEHRLQILPTANGVIVIDDAFNANPAGVRAAMEVLKGFSGQRIVVTPGMVELGDEEDAQNRAFGEIMAGSADVAILVGPKHTQPIRDGLLAKGFPEQAIHSVRTLEEATAIFGKMTKPGDVVLFENDLPDNYQE